MKKKSILDTLNQRNDVFAKIAREVLFLGVMNFMLSTDSWAHDAEPKAILNFQILIFQIVNFFRNIDKGLRATRSELVRRSYP